MRAHQWIAVSLAGCVGLASVLTRADGQAQVPAGHATTAKPAAVVNGELIPLADVERVSDMLIREKFKIQPPTEVQRRQIRLEVLDLLTNDLLMRQWLRQHGPKVDEAEVNKQIADFVASLQKEQPPRTLQDFCRETGQTEPQVRATFTTMLQWSGHVKAQVTEADVRRYFEETRDFFDQAAVRASHIVLRVAADASAADREAARQKLQVLRSEVVGGKLDFAEAARKYSQCPSAAGGGDIGYFARKGMVDETFARVAYGMKVGEVSDIVTSEYGLHLIKTTDRKPGQPADFDKIKDEVRDFYVEELRHNLLNQQRKAAKIEIHLQ